MARSPNIRLVKSLADFFWRKPTWCRISREHVPDPDDLFQREAECLRCGRWYDDAAAQQHRRDRVVSRRRSRRPVAGDFRVASQRLADHA